MDRRKMLKDFRETQWEQIARNLASRYRRWELDYKTTCPKELDVL
jgi:hypothetical protein